ncbi:various polyols ABC transporter permease component 1 [Rhodococcus aetherivorans]|uniref:Various polyols ABC transporter permease component 1 n=1 Tax=Rhodococcus aetherivorans TaxID=191292 RepID=A0ABQ0YTA8_9NOCA|nr:MULTISPECIES: sugar ABC transporter permease [Rhodococcus]ETT24365.1 ABC-type transporter, integral membrane subunit [Rhodococcus rhodochrous ATCC 21198]KDE13293.1 sugar ABC transporter permease [Rhodococcus aetherivorans]NGP29322.1 sugar ABC transporter permease [Rhodococcus aetherivorans]USC13046.1 sugar ABC transporter permease [Rhodococcus sp. 11-3]CCW14809.1 COG1175: ABC-type sugar transport systems,permease components [Rhodococcus aetherivorans]
MTSTAHAPQTSPTRAFPHPVATRPGRGHRAKRALTGWLFVLPAAAVYTVFVLRPLLSTLWYSLYNWDGISVGSWVGLGNYRRVLTDPQLLSSIGHAFFLILFFTVLPVIGGLLVAALLQEIRIRGLGTLTRTLLFLPQIIPGAAAAVAWVWMFSTNGTVNQLLSAVGLGGLTRSWLGDFDWALPAVGVIGTWLGLGFCTILLMAGIGKIDISIYEAARLDGASFLSTFRYVTVPALRAEIGVCVTVTIIAALASFDIVFMSTQGGPGYATTVPGVLIYQLGFTESRVGLASALAVVLTGLILMVILPIQRFFREK